MDNPKDNCCRWIYGDVLNGTATWCGVPVPGGGPWCQDHRRVVYVRWRPPSSASRQQQQQQEAPATVPPTPAPT